MRREAIYLFDNENDVPAYEIDGATKIADFFLPPSDALSIDLRVARRHSAGIAGDGVRAPRLLRRRMKSA